MKITNKTCLPQPIIAAIENMVESPDPKRLRVTTLIAPPIIHQLLLRHWDEVEEDASESVWRLLGKAIHGTIERVSDSKIAEKSMEKMVDGVLITGTADVADGENLYDYKVTSVWKKVFAEHIPKEWAQQINCYAYLLGRITSAKVIVIYRDWNKRQAAKDPDYPQQALMSYDIGLAPEEEQAEFVRERVRLHKEAIALLDEDLPVCSPEERWASETTYAIYKNQNKTAFRVVGTREEAEFMITNNFSKAFPKDEFRVEERVGEDKRCLGYCPVSRWCSYGKTLKKGE